MRTVYQRPIRAVTTQLHVFTFESLCLDEPVDKLTTNKRVLVVDEMVGVSANETTAVTDLTHESSQFVWGAVETMLIPTCVCVCVCVFVCRGGHYIDFKEWCYVKHQSIILWLLKITCNFKSGVVPLFRSLVTSTMYVCSVPL